MDKKELGRKIQLARKQKGLKQGQVENLLNLPEKSMTRMESGQRYPSTLELAKLADLFHMPIQNFFKIALNPEDPFVALYRAAPKLEKNPMMREAVDRYVHICKEGIFLEKLLELPPRQYVQFCSFEKPSSVLEAIQQGERVAKEERRRLGISNLPIGNIVELLSSEGIWCAETQLPPEMYGLFLFHPTTGKTILINANDSTRRQRFSCAHEYAHALFDADNQVLVSNSSNSSDLIETRANSFAAAFLMPEEGIAQMLNSLNKGQPSRSTFSIFDASTERPIEAESRQLAKNQKLSPQDVAFVSNRFGVSYQAVAYRLQNLRYLSQKEREELIELEDKGREYLRLLDIEDNKKKDKDSAPQQELRAYISRLILEAYRQEKISRGRVIELSKLLNLPPQSLLDLSDTENE